MPVAKLFWDDPYLTECDASVTSVDGDVVTLDRTVAFAFSGGQASDAATIGGREVLEARADGLEIRYRLPAGHGLRAGDAVEVRIDGDRRYRLMRLHFAAELVLELVGQRFGRPPKTGANITPDKARIDFAWDGPIATAFPVVEPELRRLVEADLPIVSAFSDEAAERRYWEVAGFARVPCGGTHPRRTGEVGEVRLKRVNPGAGVERIEISLAEDRPLPGARAGDADGEDFELCNECGGLCCALYLANDEDGAYAGDGWLPDYIEVWLARFVESGALVRDGDAYRAGAAGVEPLHDPLVSHLPTPEGEVYRAALPAWVDVRKCQFCHPDTGCLLPREYRAPICREWVCELWRAR